MQCAQNLQSENSQAQPPPRQRQGAGEGTVHSTQYMRTHTDTHQLVDCRLHFDRTPPHVHRVCQGVAGGVWWMFGTCVAAGGRVRGSCVVSNNKRDQSFNTIINPPHPPPLPASPLCQLVFLPLVLRGLCPCLVCWVSGPA